MSLDPTISRFQFQRELYNIRAYRSRTAWKRGARLSAVLWGLTTCRLRCEAEQMLASLGEKDIRRLAITLGRICETDQDVVDFLNGKPMMVSGG